MSNFKSSTTYTNSELPGVEIRQVGIRQFEVWKDGSHLGNYEQEMAIDSFAEGMFAGMLSAKKD